MSEEIAVNHKCVVTGKKIVTIEDWTFVKLETNVLDDNKEYGYFYGKVNNHHTLGSGEIITSPVIGRIGADFITNNTRYVLGNREGGPMLSEIMFHVQEISSK